MGAWEEGRDHGRLCSPLCPSCVYLSHPVRPLADLSACGPSHPGDKEEEATGPWPALQQWSSLQCSA